MSIIFPHQELKDSNGMTEGKNNTMNFQFIKAIAITSIGAALIYGGDKLKNGPTAMAGLVVGAFGGCKMMHEFEQDVRIKDLQEQAEFWRLEAQKQLSENRKLLKAIGGNQEKEFRQAKEILAIDALRRKAEQN